MSVMTSTMPAIAAIAATSWPGPTLVDVAGDPHPGHASCSRRSTPARCVSPHRA